MRRWGGLSDASLGYGVVLGTRFGLRISVVGSWGVDEAPSIRVCRTSEGGRDKSRDSGLMLRIVRGSRLLGDAAWRKGAWSSLE